MNKPKNTFDSLNGDIYFFQWKTIGKPLKKKIKAPWTDANTPMCVSSFFAAGFMLLASLAARASSYAFYVSGDLSGLTYWS